MLYKEYSMLHIKNFFLAFVAICTGFIAYRYFFKGSPHYTQDESRKARKLDMDQKTEQKTITTPSGLQYSITQEAPTGAQQPKTGDTVTVHYTGFLEQNGQQGKKFDSSVDRGQPFRFVIGTGMVIKGWDEGVMGMRVGEKRRLIIPSHLGYGARGAPGAIPPYATLLFDVELLAIN
jgi:FKBP-type peptidyl-prolyl cis-trans isomerase